MWLTHAHLTFRHSWRNALYVLLPSLLPMSRSLIDVFHWHPCWVGFIPILYSALSTRWRRSSIRLPDESPDDTVDLSESQKLPQEKLTGRRVLLLWLPAICDLTGTTVRTFTHSTPNTRPELITYAYVRLGSTAHERWLVVYPCVDLSNDAWCTSTFRWDSFRVVPAPQAVFLPVSHVVIYTALIYQRVPQMVLITDCHGRSVLGRVQWFSY